jgi:hypothetical protein
MYKPRLRIRRTKTSIYQSSMASVFVCKVYGGMYIPRHRFERCSKHLLDSPSISRNIHFSTFLLL